ncbi:hypothetical protein DXG01_001034 [Tephrocybe rancida]|nr:hypothetical protein DXG01_001034 [Tephrocybe rancida]
MADEKGSSNEPFAHDDPSTQIWTSYLSHAETLDRNLARSWKGDMDALLIFAGLFSASVTTFIIESYKTLTPNPSDATNALLTQVSLQLAAMSNTSTPLYTNGAPFFPNVPSPDAFVPSNSALVCNTLWFLSLGFSLTCALSATLVEQWVRNYLQATESRHTPHERARISAYLYRGLVKFKMAALVETIPMLLHVSLVLFFAGLVEFLRPVNAAISYLTLGMLVICVLLYALATILPIFRRDCPYHTPLSSLWWKIMQVLRVLRRHDVEGTTVIMSGSMSAAREIEATQISSERDQRDLSAMTWTLRNLRHEAEFEAFVEVIPRAVSGRDYSAKLLLHRLLYHEDPFARLGHRIPRLLMSCTGGVLDPVVCQRRAATCMAAIWSLSMMAVHTDSWETPTPVQSNEQRRFDEFTLQDIETVRSEIPAISDFAMSASTAIARGLLDTCMEQAMNQEILLNNFIECQGKKVFVYDLQEKVNENVASAARLKYSGPLRVIRIIQHNLTALKTFLASGGAIATPKAFVLISTTYIRISTLLEHISQAQPTPDALSLATQALSFLHSFRTHLNQAGFSLFADYASSFLGGPLQPLPYEAFKTLRRLFIKLDLEQPVARATQTRLVSCLDGALDPHGESRVPQSIVNILLGLARALRDPACALKAKAVIGRGMRFFASEDEARKALEALDWALPPPPPTLDLFTGHMYSNVKIDKGRSSALLGPPPTSVPRRHETY